MLSMGRNNGNLAGNNIRKLLITFLKYFNGIRQKYVNHANGIENEIFRGMLKVLVNS